MTLAIDKLPGYDAAKDAYTGELAAAKAAKDETAELRADLNWERKQREFRDQADKLEGEQRARLEAIEKVKVDFPLVPEELYAEMTNPTQILEAAGKAQAAIQGQIDARATATQRQSAQAWPAPPASGAPPSAKPGDKYNDAEYLENDLSRRFYYGNKKERDAAAEEVIRTTFDRQIMPRFSKFEAEKQTQQGGQ